MRSIIQERIALLQERKERTSFIEDWYETHFREGSLSTNVPEYLISSRLEDLLRAYLAHGEEVYHLLRGGHIEHITPYPFNADGKTTAVYQANVYGSTYHLFSKPESYLKHTFAAHCLLCDDPPELIFAGSLKGNWTGKKEKINGGISLKQLPDYALKYAFVGVKTLDANGRVRCGEPLNYGRLVSKEPVIIYRNGSTHVFDLLGNELAQTSKKAINKKRSAHHEIAFQQEQQDLAIIRASSIQYLRTLFLEQHNDLGREGKTLILEGTIRSALNNTGCILFRYYDDVDGKATLHQGFYVGRGLQGIFEASVQGSYVTLHDKQFKLLNGKALSTPGVVCIRPNKLIQPAEVMVLHPLPHGRRKTIRLNDEQYDFSATTVSGALTGSGPYALFGHGAGNKATFSAFSLINDGIVEQPIKPAQPF